MRLVLFAIFLVLASPLSGRMLCVLIECCEETCCEDEASSEVLEHVDAREASTLTPRDLACCSLCELGAHEVTTHEILTWHTPATRLEAVTPRPRHAPRRAATGAHLAWRRQAVAARAGPRLHLLHCVWRV